MFAFQSINHLYHLEVSKQTATMTRDFFFFFCKPGCYLYLSIIVRGPYLFHIIHQFGIGRFLFTRKPGQTYNLGHLLLTSSSPAPYLIMVEWMQTKYPPPSQPILKDGRKIREGSEKESWTFFFLES